MLSESELEGLYAGAAGDDPSQRWARGLRAVYEAGAAAERSRVVELAARRADEGYRLGESCDDIARDIRALSTPAEPDEREEGDCG